MSLAISQPVSIQHGPGKSAKKPAYIAPTATVCGDMTIGAESRVLFGAVLVAEGGPVAISDHVLVGPHARPMIAPAG